MVGLRCRKCSEAVFLLAVFVSTTACASTAETPTEGISAGDPALFCARWPEARGALATEFEGEEPDEVRGQVDRAHNTLQEIGALVPASLRTTWGEAIRFQDTVITLVRIAGFQPERLRQELIDAAFGEGGVEVASAGSVVAIGRLDAWAVEECGDFCEWWPRLDSALAFDDDLLLLLQRGDADEAQLLMVEGIVPEAIRSDWETAAGLKLAWLDLFRSWESERLWERLTEQEQEAAWSEALGLTDTVIESYDFPQEVRQQGIRGITQEISTRHRTAIAAWAAENCAGLGTSGLPGTVTVAGPPTGAVGELLVAAVPVGTDLSTIDDASGFLGVACSEPDWADQTWSAVLLDRERGFDSPCTAPHMTIWGTAEAVLPAGDYELFAAHFPTGVGSFDVYVPAPETCATARFTVDGDTEVTLPELRSCDLGPLAGTPEEIARRRPSAVPAGAAGTLRVVLAEYPEDVDELGFYRMVVLPHGTTLDEIGLGEAWPAGSGCLRVEPPRHFDPNIVAAIAAQGVAIPILAFPASPYDDQFCWPAPAYLGFGHQWGENVAPIDLAAGEYDVYVTFEVHREEGEFFWCGESTVSVAGETVVEMPPLEECP